MSKLFLFWLEGFLFTQILAFGLPSLVEALYWKFSSTINKKGKLLSFFLSVIYSMFCIPFFVLHWVAFLYSFYWFIPIVLYLVKKNKNYSSIFYRDLMASFFAHCAGSIIW